MTTNQVAYWTLVESKRSNLAREEETHRSNIANETETHRHNVATESNQYIQAMAAQTSAAAAWSQAQTAALRQSADAAYQQGQLKVQQATLNENIRHNHMTEYTQRQETAVHQQQADEAIRHNMETERINEQNADANMINAVTGSQRQQSESEHWENQDTLGLGKVLGGMLGLLKGGSK